MSSRAARVAVAMVAALVAAVASASAPPAAHSMAGFLRYEQNKWLFHPCGIADARTAKKAVRRGQPFSDGSPDGVLFRAVQERWRQSVDPLRGVYLEFSGYQEHGRTTAVDLQRALGWVDRCENRPTNIPADATIWAAGNEPGWRVVYDGTTGHLQLPDKRVAPLRELRAEPGNGVLILRNDTVRIEIFTELCADTMAEASFGRRVTATVRGRVLQGCGLVR